MVRLLHGRPAILVLPDVSFQSHNGAIAATKIKYLSFGISGFQSHNGAIAADNREVNFNSPSDVSIPQWCDCCCSLSTAQLGLSPKFQSHNGAIAAGFKRYVVELRY